MEGVGTQIGIYMYTYIYVYICIRIYICTYIYSYLHLYIYMMLSSIRLQMGGKTRLVKFGRATDVSSRAARYIRRASLCVNDKHIWPAGRGILFQMLC